MNHPIYSGDFYINQLFALYEKTCKAKNEETAMNEIRSALKKGIGAFEFAMLEMGETLYALFRSVEVMYDISRNGHILVRTKKDEWTSDISEKTLTSLDIGYFTFPFKAGTIQIDDISFHYSYSYSYVIPGGKHAPAFSLFFYDDDRGIRTLNIGPNTRIGDAI